jgi:hypothetical protein
MIDDKRNRAHLLDPAELDALGGLELVARAVVTGFISGLHSSPSRGFSVEFAEHRAYRPGDDLRFVDWKMYGRSDRFFLKQYEEETNLSAHVCLDVSSSMDWRSREAGLLTKLEYAKRLAASRSWCASLPISRREDKRRQRAHWRRSRHAAIEGDWSSSYRTCWWTRRRRSER